MKTKARVRIVAGFMVVAMAMAGVGLVAPAAEGERLLTIASELGAEASVNLLGAMFDLVDGENDVDDGIAFLEDPRGFLAARDVELDAQDFRITAIDISAAREIEGAFKESPVASGLQERVFCIGFQSDQVLLLLEDVVESGEVSDAATEGDTGFSLPLQDTGISRYVELVVKTSDSHLADLRSAVGIMSLDAVRRERAIAEDPRQYLAEQVGVVLTTDEYGVQIFDMGKLERGVHYQISEAERSVSAEAIGIILTNGGEGPEWAVTFQFGI